MSDERQDDEILGRALARAIETIDVNETPYEESRTAVPPATRPFFTFPRLATALAAIVLAVAAGAWLNTLRETRDAPAGASPAAPSASTSMFGPGNVPAATASATAVDPNRDRIWVYFARDGLPPVGGYVTGILSEGRPEAHILSRLNALRQAKTGIPSGVINPFAEPAATQSGSSTFALSARVQGDLATVEFDISGGWAVRGSAQSLALLQQLVYTITEEPGVRRALITQKGMTNAVIDQLVVDKPLAREDVFGYTVPPVATISSGPFDPSQAALTSDLSVAFGVNAQAQSLGFFIIQVHPTSAAPIPFGWVPTFAAELTPNVSASQPGKATLSIRVAYGRDSRIPFPPGQSQLVVDQTPIRTIDTIGDLTGTTYRLGLDDARPWRAAVTQATSVQPAQIVVTVGGAPESISDRIAVDLPAPSTVVTRDLRVIGQARVFEANVSWRVRDSSNRVVASGHFNASLGTSGVWGTFDTTIAIPTSVSGNVTLELYEASAKDGSEVGLVRVPLTVR